MVDVLAVCCYGELEMHCRDVIRDTLLLIFLLFYKNVTKYSIVKLYVQ